MSEPALLAAIAASPDDDLPRLVYADWLDENGQPLRAEFIRLQIEIAKKETLPRAVVNVFSHLWKRQQEILDDHRDELLGPLDRNAGQHLEHVQFRRGFLERIQLHLSEFFHLQSHLRSLRPRPEVSVWETLHRFDGFSDADLITELHTSCSSHQGVRIEELAAFCKRLPRLKLLDLEDARYGDDDIVALFAPPSFPALIDLDLSFNDLTDTGVIALLNTGVPQRLKRLVLGGNPIGDQAAIELADRLSGSTVLENLNLRMTNIGRPGQVALTRAFGGRVDLF